MYLNNNPINGNIDPAKAFLWMLLQQFLYFYIQMKQVLPVELMMIHIFRVHHACDMVLNHGDIRK